ncbi:response regulator transcription factor [Listeria booriae]|uniref:Response regulator transcription factor n=1 Tax=Listeria booriae TaxID=1552123 RepID=A0A7X0Z3E0_9LIST|nr:response regulator transcription factor [Listeria booriae]MBC1211066.1 response regulator transcription factor [Listeria booriae]MBC1230460.1 response regulator transcription factor [Listeria booriae]MBC1233725.1 response regulator transcription factor [Listeria booriae]MBC1245974.1 response regulator transcription factor [Listeria booriae]MBC1286702.1 response regulator transcription factor [Listeria booriae]
MLKMLLVDDEPLIVQGLQAVIREFDEEIEIIGTAKNGMEALTHFATQPCDLVITDIKMPKMDGLQLIEAWKKEQDTTKFIVLSGFQEFEYVKRGLAIGIENYLLKPLNETELLETITQIKEKVEADFQATGDDEAYYILRDNALWRWLNNRIGTEDWKERMALYKMPLAQDQMTALIWIQPMYGRRDWTADGWRKLQSYLRAEYPFMLLNPEEELLIGLMAEDETGIATQIAKVYDEIGAIVGAEQCFFLMSEVGTGTAYFPKAFRQLEQLLQERLVSSPGTLISADKILPHRWRPNFSQHQLARALVLREKEETLAWLDAFFAEWELHLYESDPHQVIRVLSEVALMMSESDPEQLLTVIRRLDGAITPCELKNTMLELIHPFFDRKQHDDNSKSPIIQKILTYVAENFTEGMSLKTLGAKFHINAVYLGQLFQKEVGVHFTDYLNQFRVNHAKEILMSTKQPVTTIAEESGYTDMAYFYRQFKKYTGYTPNGFRKKETVQ